MRSELSFEDYASWCKSRFPASDPESCPDSFRQTMYPDPSDEPCPVTVRSSRDRVILTPAAKRSR